MPNRPEKETTKVYLQMAAVVQDNRAELVDYWWNVAVIENETLSECASLFFNSYLYNCEFIFHS